jgi:uncharacterized membrane protein
MKTTVNRDWIELAIAGLITGAALATSQPARADDAGREQCAGVVRAGQNDCATSTNACHSHVETDANPEAWIYVPKGTCDKIAGARIVMVVDPTPVDQSKN